MHGGQASFDIPFLTIKSKSGALENTFSNASNIFLHKLYYNISQLFLESLKTQENQIMLRGLS
jgi:hypothetical protein